MLRGGRSSDFYLVLHVAVGFSCVSGDVVREGGGLNDVYEMGFSMVDSRGCSRG